MTVQQALIESLHRWGVIRSPQVESAVQQVAWEALLPLSPAASGFLYAPIPHPDGLFDLTPRVSVLLAELFELKPGMRVALPTPRPRFLAALVEALGARVFDPLRNAVADRVFEVAPAARAAPLTEDGFALRVSFEPHDESLTKRVHTAHGDAEMGLEKVTIGGTAARPARHLLVVEGFLRRSLSRRPFTAQDDLFVRAVDETWDPPAATRATLTPAERERLDAAQRWFRLAYIHQFTGEVGDAIELYHASIVSHPTSEAHTFLGWALSFLGDLRGAILECERAIEVDPSLGNPYNDIGAYWLELGQPRRALPWFERALEASRYEAPHFAHCNAGRALLELGLTKEARQAFECALELAPDYKPAAEFLRRIKER